MAVDHPIPPPLVPPEVDLTGFPFMPLEVARLRRSKSWLAAKRNPAVGFYMINLWTSSWHEVPAASLEDDDDVLADRAMCEPRQWSKVRAAVLAGWVKCSDGRLYHPVVAEKAIAAWQAKQGQRQKTEAARLAREQKRLQSLSGASTDTVKKSVTENVTASNREGEGEREEEQHSQKNPPGEGHGRERAKPSGPNAAGRLVVLFDQAQERVYGDQRRQMPASQDFTTAGRMLELGLTEADAPGLFEAVLARCKAQGKPAPRSLKYLEGAVADHVAGLAAPLPQASGKGRQPSAGEGVVADYDPEKWLSPEMLERRRKVIEGA